jgi:DNA-binding CsgD family transcriptional regulator
MNSGLGSFSDLSFEDILKKRELPCLLIVESTGRIVFASEEARHFLAEMIPGDNENGGNRRKRTSRGSRVVPSKIAVFCREIAKQQSATGWTQTRKMKSPSPTTLAVRHRTDNQGQAGGNQVPRRAMLFLGPSSDYMVVAVSLARPELSTRRKLIFLVIQKIGRRKSLDPEQLGQRYGLTKREHEVVARLVHGDCNKAIAESLQIHEYTVKDHLKHIMAKCEADSRVSIISKLFSL